MLIFVITCEQLLSLKKGLQSLHHCGKFLYEIIVNMLIFQLPFSLNWLLFLIGTGRISQKLLKNWIFNHIILLWRRFNGIVFCGLRRNCEIFTSIFSTFMTFETNFLCSHKIERKNYFYSMRNPPYVCLLILVLFRLAEPPFLNQQGKQREVSRLLQNRFLRREQRSRHW